MLSHLYKTLFGHLLLRLFNYTYSLIQTSQIPISDSEPMCLSFGSKRLFLNKLSLWTRILHVKSSEVRYYLELKSKEDRVLERLKGKDSMKITKMFIHIKYSLKVEVHRYYNGVQDATL